MLDCKWQARAPDADDIVVVKLVVQWYMVIFTCYTITPSMYGIFVYICLHLSTKINEM